METKLHNSSISAGGLGKSHESSLVGGTAFISYYGSRLVDSVGFLVVSLTSLASLASNPSSPSSTRVHKLRLIINPVLKPLWEVVNRKHDCIV